MTFPELIVSVADDWLRGQLRGAAAAARWRFRAAPGPAAVRPAARPTVVTLGADPAAPDAALAAVTDLAARRPDVAVVVLTETKLSDDPRAAWAAAVLDLGARAVLFPPYTRLVLDDLLSAAMAAAVRRSGGPAPGPPADAPIDLAGGDYEEPA